MSNHLPINPPYGRLHFPKYRLVFHFCSGAFQRLLNQINSGFKFIFWRQLRKSCRVWYRYRRINSVRSNGIRDRHDGAQVHDRNTCIVDLFYQRCPATRIGSSCGGQQYSIDTVVFKLFCHFLSVFGRLLNIHAVSNGNQHFVVELANDASAF